MQPLKISGPQQKVAEGALAVVTHKRPAPSQAWRNQVFDSPPRRMVNRVNKSTTRVQLHLPGSGFVFVEGQHEATALMLLKHFQRHQMVVRMKVQPFDLSEIDGPHKHVPDFLVETGDGRLVVIQVKAHRFITPDVQAQFDKERECLEDKGFDYEVWTDKSCLGNPAWTSIRAIERGSLLPIKYSELEAFQEFAQQQSLFGPLLDKFGWDFSCAALAEGAAFVNVLESLNETSKLYHRFPGHFYSALLSGRHDYVGFWDRLVAR